MTILQFQQKEEPLKLSCTSCGATTDAACGCGVPYESLSLAQQKERRRAKAVDLYKTGLTMEQIAERLKVDQKTISRDLEGLGNLPKPPRPKGGRPKAQASLDGKSYTAERKARPKKDPKADIVREAIRETVKAGKPIERKSLAKELDVSEGTIQTAVMQERAYLEGLKVKGKDNSSHKTMVSVQLLIEKLDPLFEEASTVAKAQHDNTLGTTGLRLKILLLEIANRGRQLLNEWASGNETVRLTPGLKKDKARRERARAFR